MKVIPAMVIVLVKLGVRPLEAANVAVSAAVSGTFAGVQFAAVVQLLPGAGEAIHVCAWLEDGINTRLHSAAIDVASILAGLAVGGRGVVWVAFLGTQEDRFMEVISDFRLGWESCSPDVLFPKWPAWQAFGCVLF